MIELTLNGIPLRTADDPEQPMLWWLRDRHGLTGAKYGCGQGMCGACTVHLDGAAVRSCVVPLAAAAGRRVLTIEGLTAEHPQHPLLRAWVRHRVPQCGYCQTGQIMTAAALPATSPGPRRQAVIEAMDGNLCRCGTYSRILAAVLDAADGAVD